MARKRFRSPEASLEPGNEGDAGERPSESDGEQDQDATEPPAQRHKPASVEICTAEASEDAGGGNAIDNSQAKDAHDQTTEPIPPTTPRQPQIMNISASTMHDPHSGESARDRPPPPLLSSLSAKRLMPLMPPPLARSCSVTALMRGSKDLLVRFHLPDDPDSPVPSLPMIHLPPLIFTKFTASW